MSKLNLFNEELNALIRARYPLILLQSFEEQRVIDILQQIGLARKSELYQWSRASGITKSGKNIAKTNDPVGVLNWYEGLDEKSVLVLTDFHPFIKDPLVVRKLRELSFQLKHQAKNIVLLSPSMFIPEELSKEMIVLDVPLPEEKEIQDIVKKALEVLTNEGLSEDINTVDIVNASKGLTHDEIENVLAKSIVLKKTLDFILVRNEKKEIVKKSGVLEFIDVKKNDTANIGGLKNLKKWLVERKRGLSTEAQELGLPAPKGVLLVGVPGCGKSLTASTICNEWNLPLLRLDLGRVFSGLVGSSENNIRNAIKTAEAVAPCILWIDEIEKGLSGTKSGGDSGTSARVFGTVLTWMQEKKSPVFVVATANDISGLPPEFLRKGRFDEIFYIDLPTFDERKEIFDIVLQKYQWPVENIDIDQLAHKTTQYSGAEIEQIVISARYASFSNATNFKQDDLLSAIADTVPLAKTMREQIEDLRKWAEHRARPASTFKAEEIENSFESRARSMELRDG